MSKSKFKSHALEYFRQVEESGEELTITDCGRPILKVIPYAADPSEPLKTLRDTVLKYEDPTGAVGLEDWEALKRKAIVK